MMYEKLRDTGGAESDEGITAGLLDGEVPSTATRKPPYSRGRVWFVLALEHVLLVVLLVVLWKTLVPPRTQLHYQVLTADNKSYPSGPLSWSHRFEALPCGRTPQEAVERGCEFDMLVTAWLPPRCIDRALVDEFLRVGQWQFYTKWHGTEADRLPTYDPAYVGSLNRTIWTSRRWHVTHCLFMFKKLSRALVRGWTVDGEAVSEPHMEHCMKTYVDQVLFGPGLDLDEVETYLEIIYPPC
ncbi:hypothetical protein VTK73DRAFT_7289 [Phialemonium thermophilum]|uniref:Uncharacterized protein n=1 Tax=Phialemonium thermophilum TaxID=223376 RepID=A0ABR3WFM6_9PEZI